jgi:hypothetical protein
MGGTLRSRSDRDRINYGEAEEARGCVATWRHGACTLKAERVGRAISYGEREKSLIA